MNKQIPDYINYALRDMKSAVQRDSYNLTRDDHDAILHQIDILEQFIKERYASHGDQQLDTQQQW